MTRRSMGRQGVAILHFLAVVATASTSAVGGEAVRATPGDGPSEQRVSFNRDVRPILANNCIACHGPDEDAREADLRLDTWEGATADLGGYQAVQPGAPDESELIRRVISDDEFERMPPPDSNKTLTPEQIETLRRWVEQGGEFEQHWAFTPPRRPVVPELRDGRFAAWTQHPVDRFVLERMLSEGLEPSPEADALTLIRRLYLDLIGLPPTPAEADAWTDRLLSHPSNSEPVDERAYGELVDHLLASPHYGERWGRKWLDLARYADTNGYEKDRPRDIWPYRDWVIRALNADMPFDQFTIEQLAGDMLPNPTRDQLIATGFHRNTMLNEEGGIDPLEYRYYAMTDRVATTGTAWMGLTMGCVQCHSHKYDPITHEEYFRVMALLNNADEPELELATDEDELRYRSQLKEADRLLRELPGHWPIDGDVDAEQRRREAVQQAFAQWLQQEREATRTWVELRPATAASNLPLLTVQSDLSVFVSGDITKDDTYVLTFTDVPAGVTAVRLEVLPDDRLPARGPGMTYFEGPKGDFFLGEFQMLRNGERLSIASASESYAKNHFGASPVSATLATDGDPETGWSCADRYGEPHQAVFVLAEPLTLDGDLTITMRFGRHYPCSLGRFRLSVTTDASGAEARDLPREIEQLLMLSDQQLTALQRDQLREAFLMSAEPLAEQAARIRALRKRPAIPTTLVFRERPPENPRPTHLHHRGEFLQPRQQVTPGVPAFLPALPDNAPANRLAFARWLVAPEHPLTARVQVNRHWSSLFGHGLVRTEGDFGLQGDPPTHPELLDWLAVEFVEQGQSVKTLHRLLVTSATYRQSSRATPDRLAKDPQNLWLSRATRVRATAEQARDMLLQAAGLLETAMFGPPVYPPQPEGALETAYGGASWPVSSGPDRYRRGIYTFMKRTAPYAMFHTFDAPSGEVCIAQRETSNTPLQSLTLLNDTVVLEAAEHLGQLAARQQGTDQDKAAWLFRRCVTRPPQGKEQAVMLAFLGRQRERLANEDLNETTLLPHTAHQATPPTTPDQQAEAVSSGAPAGPPDASPGEHLRETAAWTLLARALLNLDETIHRN